MRELQCDRCGTSFRQNEEHTEIVRRDFAGEPQPSRIEHLCGNCLEAYESFVDADPG